MATSEAAPDGAEADEILALIANGSAFLVDLLCCSPTDFDHDAEVRDLGGRLDDLKTEIAARIRALCARCAAAEAEVGRMRATIMPALRASEFAVSMWAGGPTDPSELDEALGFLHARLLELPPDLMLEATAYPAARTPQEAASEGQDDDHPDWCPCDQCMYLRQDMPELFAEDKEAADADPSV